jgi:PhoPQ-activated pathogenicity-related protein
MVIDVLNMEYQMRLQKSTFGKPSEEIQDYTERGLTEQLESPEANALRAIVDPFSYRDQLTQPKLIILGTNDRYWPLEALNLYWDGLSGSKYVMYVPNNGHGLNDIGRLSGSLLAFHQHMAAGKPLPRLTWKFEQQDGRTRLRVDSDVVPQRVDTWFASAPSRDFREAKWSSRPARQDGKSFVCELQRPESGYAAMFGELVYDGQPLPYFLSTNVRIVPAGEAKVGGD